VEICIVSLGRQIIYTTNFDLAVEKLGGYRIVDLSLEMILDGLYRNPFGFNKFENDFVSFRYAITKKTAWAPALVVTFTIGQNGDVTLEHIEEYEQP
jgi:hypothetical protein